MNELTVRERAVAALIHDHATHAPAAEAIRHRRGDGWNSWSWAALAHRLDALTGALRRRGVGPQTSVFLCGDYAPTLVLFALAARNLGAPVVAVPLAATTAEIMANLGAREHALAFLGRREPVDTWTRLRRETGDRVRLVADFHLPWGQIAGDGIVASITLLDAADAGEVPAETADDVVWVEETTDWPGGIDVLLGALASGTAIALPETSAAAHRDRREAQPETIILSGRHLARLSRDLAARLPLGSGPTARTVAGAMRSARDGRPSLFDRWLLARLRTPLGLRRVRTVTVIGPAPADAEAEASVLFRGLGIACGASTPGSAGLRSLAFA